MKPLNTYYAGYRLRIILIEQRGMELRYNHNHDDRGRFTFSTGSGNVTKGVDKSRKSAIIKSGVGNVALENQRYGRNKDTLVDKTPIDSGAYNG